MFRSRSVCTRAIAASMITMLSAFLVHGTASAAYIRVSNSGSIWGYPTCTDLVQVTDSTLFGSAGIYGDDAGFFFDPNSGPPVVVSLPATVWIFLPALCGLGLFDWRRRRATA